MIDLTWVGNSQRTCGVVCEWRVSCGIKEQKNLYLSLEGTPLGLCHTIRPVPPKNKEIDPWVRATAKKKATKKARHRWMPLYNH